MMERCERDGLCGTSIGMGCVDVKMWAYIVDSKRCEGGEEKQCRTVHNLGRSLG